jgi:peptidoglycan hydrolase CwlO-like protein
VNGGDILVNIAQVAVGGSLVQGLVLLVRRRSELRQLDRQTDSVSVATADQVVVMLRTELADAKKEIKQLKDEREDQQRQIQALGERVSQIRADLVIAQAELARLRG